MKLCKDCKYFQSAYAYIPAKCLKERNLVYGGPMYHCNKARYTKELCGEDGEWFELIEPKKKSFFVKLFSIGD